MLLNCIDTIKAMRQNRVITVIGKILVKRPQRSIIFRVRELSLVNSSVPERISIIRVLKIIEFYISYYY